MNEKIIRWFYIYSHQLIVLNYYLEGKWTYLPFKYGKIYEYICYKIAWYTTQYNKLYCSYT